MRSTWRLLFILVTALAALPLACTEGEQAEPSPEVTQRIEGRSRLQKQLTGTWVRRVRAVDSLSEGLRLDPDGRFGLFGIHTLHGLQWLVRGDTLVLTTSTQEYAQPQESRLWVRRADADSLMLSAETGYLAGSYGRGVDLARRITGTIKGLLPEPTADAALFLELRGVLGKSSSKYLASQSLSVTLLHSSVPFHVYYAATDAQECDEGYLVVSLAINGVPRYVLASGFPVGLTDDVDGVEIWMSGPE